MKLFKVQEAFVKKFHVLFFVLNCFLFSCCSINSFQESNLKKISFACWNVQTFFDAYCDGFEYSDFQKTEKWTKEKYIIRLNRLCEVMKKMDCDIFVFEEIENEAVIQDIANRLQSESWNKTKFWHYSCFAKEPGSSIGCAVFSRFELSDLQVHALDIRCHKIKQPSERPLMQVSINIGEKKLELFICHWKSKSGGEIETEIWRDWQEFLLSENLSAFSECSNSPVLICGDFNRSVEAFISEKENNKIILRGKQEHNNQVDSPWFDDEGFFDVKKGSYFYKGNWERIDNIFIYGNVSISDFRIYTDENIVDEEGLPFAYKIYSGKGYSDHLPLMCVLSI